LGCIRYSDGSCAGNGFVISEAVQCTVTCPVEPLKPITDPDAIRFENGDNIRTDRLTANVILDLQCLRNSLSLENPPGTLTVTSAWRPQTYQSHLFEIYTKIKLLDLPANQANTSCASVRAAIEGERGRHGIANWVTKTRVVNGVSVTTRERNLVGKTSNHRHGTAFDATWSVTDTRFDALAGRCNVRRNLLNANPPDRPHLESTR
jgi:hypothetical protein